jgi:hypothetical protein
MSADRHKPTAGGTRYRFSDAAKCARYLSLVAAGFEGEPFDAPAIHVMKLGEMLHEHWQEAVLARYPDAVVEGKGTVDLTSGHCDLLVVVDGRRILVELKTVGGFKFKKAVGERGAAEGPSSSYIVQSALNARAHDADEAVIVMMATEAIGKGTAERKGFSEYGRFLAEWTFTRAQLDRYADEEQKRLEAIDGLVADGKLAPRHVPYEMPPGSRIVDTDRAMWTLTDGGDTTDTGQVWSGQLCLYCAQKPNCDKFADPGTPAFRSAADEVA